MLQCWHLVWILIRTDHSCLGVGCHSCHQTLALMGAAPGTSTLAISDMSTNFSQFHATLVKHRFPM
jgi:hypothetical protein